MSTSFLFLDRINGPEIGIAISPTNISSFANNTFIAYLSVTNIRATITAVNINIFIKPCAQVGSAK